MNSEYNEPSSPRVPPNFSAIFSLVLSIGSITCCCVWYMALLGSVLSIVLGIFGLTNKNPTGKDAAIAGIVVGAVAFVLALVTAGFTIYLSKTAGTV